jgi:hypothetical protein
MDDFDAYTTNKHAGNPVPMDTEKRDLYLRIAELEAEVKELRRDAERYRWMRDKHDDGDEQWFVYGAKSDSDSTLDDDIDAAMEGK